jgi:OPA family glycerol-3-phosphate transporter-like MFS transporter 3
MSNWFPKRGRGLLIGCWASNANVGDIIGAQIYRAASVDSNIPANIEWGNGIMIVAALVIIVGVINQFFLIEFPQDKGIVIEEESHILDFKSKTPVLNSERKVEKSISFWNALMIPGVILFSLSFFFIKFSMYGFYYWLPTYLQEGLGYTKDASANIFSLFGVGAICGNLLMGLSTDLLTIRSPVFILGIIVSTLSTLALTLWGDS